MLEDLPFAQRLTSKDVDKGIQPLPCWHRL